MKEVQTSKEPLQWHPAFYAGIQIELEKESDRLTFENEHQLGTMPKEIDVLIIKKEKYYQVKKNIGKIFRTHNIIEYKSPSDYLSVDDFYRVYGYACFYKADTGREDSIPIEELTISFVCKSRPKKFISHLETSRGYSLCRQEPGIYYLKGDKLPIQLIITAELSEAENLWLKSLTDSLPGKSEARRLVSRYQKHKDNVLYESVMDIIVRANNELFQEEKHMCNALRELWHDELEEAKAKMREDIRAEVRAEIQEEVRAETRTQMQKEIQAQNKLHLISLIRKKIKKNKPLTLIAQELEEEPDSIRGIYDMVIADPDADEKEIYHRLHPAKELKN